MSAVTFLDSSGLNALLRVQMTLSLDGRRLVLQRPTPAVRRVFDIAGLAGAFEIT